MKNTKFPEESTNVPIATQWILDAAGETGRSAVKAVFMIACSSTGSKGSGFLLENGLIVTNEHVIRGCIAQQIAAYSLSGQEERISQIWIDEGRDLAILRPVNPLHGGLVLGDSSSLQVGESVTTWGYPLGYNGPAPLLSVGYLAGFKEHKVHLHTKKHLVVNGAFNSGNSGGALFRSSDNKVIGIVVSKHAPISYYHQTAIEALAKNSAGFTYTATNERGQSKKFFESQIVAELLIHMRSLTQVMIGEAIAIEELITMLGEIDLTPPTLSRNSPCYCRSGKRFKECHGKL